MAHQPEFGYSQRMSSDRLPYQDYLPKPSDSHEFGSRPGPPGGFYSSAPWQEPTPGPGQSYAHSSYSHHHQPEFAHASRYGLGPDGHSSSLGGPRPNANGLSHPHARIAPATADARLSFRNVGVQDDEPPLKFRRESLVSASLTNAGPGAVGPAPLSRSNSSQFVVPRLNHSQTQPQPQPQPQPYQPHGHFFHSEPPTPSLDYSSPGPQSHAQSSAAYFFSPTNQSPYTPSHAPPHASHPSHAYSHSTQPVSYGYSPQPTPFGMNRSDSGPVEYAAPSHSHHGGGYASHHLDEHHHPPPPSSLYNYQNHSIGPNLTVASGSSAGSLSRPPTRSESASDAQPSAPSYHSPLLASAQGSAHNSPVVRHQLASHASQPSLPPLASVVSPLIPPPAIPHVRAASSARRAFRSRPPPLTFNPAREPSASARLSKSLTSQGLVVPAQGAKGKAVLEIVGSCWTCGEPSCKVILRGQDLGFGPRLSFTCLACLPTNERPGLSDSDGEERGEGGKKIEAREPVYSDTLSAAVDVIEGVELRSVEEEPPEVTSAKLPVALRPQGMKCDVCDRVVGCGTIAPADPNIGPAPPFTSEVICSRCSEKYKACSDCGGGGGRLTPGRWRCKELFPQGRRTCQLSHARNPPLNEITYHVLPITSVGALAREELIASCRQLYFNTRLRVTARPEMLERGDGLCRTFAEAEKLTIDGWGLLQPLMEVDVEQERGIRRYVAVQYSIPHRRRAKNKSEPPPEENAERTVSGFMLVEYEFATGAIYFAVVMPWALSGDAFDATTKLGENVFAKAKADLIDLNSRRVANGLPEYPPLSWNWGITPFKKESRMTQSLTRRGYQFLDEMKESGEMPLADLRCFPEGGRKIHVPEQFVKAFHVFVRPVEASLRGSSQASAPGSKRVRQRVRKRKISN